MSACHQLWAHRAIGRTGNLFFGILMLSFGLFLIWQGVPGYTAGFLLIAACGVIALDFWRERIWREHYRNEAIYREPITIEISDEGVRQNRGEARPWTNFKNYVLTKGFIILIIDSREFLALPISAMETANNHADFEEIVKAKVKRLRGRLI